MAQYSLDTDIQYLPGVGPKRADLLEKELGVSTLGELIRFYPFRYIDRTSFVRIADVRPDMAYIQLKARVLRVELIGTPSEAPGVQDGAEATVKYNMVKRMSVWVGDGTGEMEIVFFLSLIHI